MGQLWKELSVQCSNTVGTFAKACGSIKEVGVNIKAACAYGEKDKACFMIVTENNAKAAEALKKAGFQVTENEVVVADLPCKVGSLAESAQKLAGAGVDVNYCYVTQGTGGSACYSVWNTKNNKKAVGLI